MSNKFYDTLKTITLRVLPPLYTLIAALYAATGYDGTVTLAIIGAVFTFIGQVVGISNIKFVKSEREAETALISETNNGLHKGDRDADQTPEPDFDESEVI